MFQVDLDSRVVFSKIVGGADADIIIDGVLFDLKTRNKLGYVGGDFAQLFGYAAMAQKVGMDLKAVGIYHARFGVFASVKVKSKDRLSSRSLLYSINH